MSEKFIKTNHCLNCLFKRTEALQVPHLTKLSLEPKQTFINRNLNSKSKQQNKNKWTLLHVYCMAKLDLTSGSREYSLHTVVAMKAPNLIRANLSFLDLKKTHQIFSTRAMHCYNHDGWCVLSDCHHLPTVYYLKIFPSERNNRQPQFGINNDHLNVEL